VKGLEKERDFRGVRVGRERNCRVRGELRWSSTGVGGLSAVAIISGSGGKWPIQRLYSLKLRNT